MQLINLVSKKFGRLLVLCRARYRSKGGSIRWKCGCDCGNEITVHGNNLRRGLTRSCGCLQKENASRRMKGNHKCKSFVRRLLASRRRVEYREASRTRALALLSKGVIGFYPIGRWTRTRKGGRIFCRSVWELEFDKLCNSTLEIRKIVAEPFQIKYRSFGEDLDRVYVPDRLLTFRNGDKVLVEVKPKKIGWREGKVFEAKCRAAKRFCRRLDIKFVVLAKSEFSNFLASRKVA